MAFVRTARTNQEIEDILTTQKELFASLKNRGSASSSTDEPLPPFIKFIMEGDVIQGEVVDTYVTNVYNPSTKSAQLDKNGDEIPQLNVTLKLTHASGKVKGEDGKDRKAVEGELVRQSFANDLLWKLTDALQELGADEVVKGMTIASRWEGMFTKPNGEVTRAREHKVIVKAAE